MREGFSFKLTGDREMLAKIKAAAVEHPKRVKRALYMRAERIMTRSKQEFVPKDEGTLRGTGMTHPVEEFGSNFSVLLTYGGPSAPYAMSVHENPSQYDPPSWRGKSITFQPSGHGPGFLRKPLLEALSTLGRDLAGDLHL